MPSAWNVSSFELNPVYASTPIRIENSESSLAYLRIAAAQLCLCYVVSTILFLCYQVLMFTIPLLMNHLAHSSTVLMRPKPPNAHRRLRVARQRRQHNQVLADSERRRHRHRQHDLRSEEPYAPIVHSYRRLQCASVRCLRSSAHWLCAAVRVQHCIVAPFRSCRCLCSSQTRAL